MNKSPIDIDELVQMLSHTLGEVKARELLDEAMRSLGVRQSALTVEKALVVLETIAQKPGIVGTTARFAKSRVLLGALGKHHTG